MTTRHLRELEYEVLQELVDEISLGPTRNICEIVAGNAVRGMEEYWGESEGTMITIARRMAEELLPKVLQSLLNPRPIRVVVRISPGEIEIKPSCLS